MKIYRLRDFPPNPHGDLGRRQKFLRPERRYFLRRIQDHQRAHRCPLDPRAGRAEDDLRHRPELPQARGGNRREESRSTPSFFSKAPPPSRIPAARSSCPANCAATRSISRPNSASIIGYECKNVSRAEALNYVLGYTIANDVSARDWQKTWGGSQWCRGKTFDTFCPLGPAFVTPDEHQESEQPRHLHARQRRDHAAEQHPRHDFLRRRDHRVPQRQHHARARHADPDRHAGRRRHGPQAARLSQGRATWSRSRSKASASCAIRSSRKSFPERKFPL